MLLQAVLAGRVAARGARLAVVADVGLVVGVVGVAMALDGVGAGTVVAAGREVAEVMVGDRTGRCGVGVDRHDVVVNDAVVAVVVAVDVVVDVVADVGVHVHGVHVDVVSHGAVGHVHDCWSDRYAVVEKVVLHGEGRSREGGGAGSGAGGRVRV